MTALYKQQAERLAEHFSDVHRFRLKPARAHEAIAAVHGARDWNTLLATRSAAAVTTSAQLIETPARTSLFDAVRLEDPSVHSLVLAQTMEVTSSDPEARDSLLEQLLRYQARRGPVVYFDLARQPRRQRVLTTHAPTAAPYFHCFDAARQDTSSFNALAGANADHAAMAVLQLLPRTENSPGADFYRQSMNHALTVIFGAMLAAGEAVTLGSIFDLLQDAAALVALYDRTPSGADKEALKLFLNQFVLRSDIAGGLNCDKLRTVLGGLLGRLAVALREYGHVLCPAGEPKFSWHDALTRNESVYVRSRDSVIAEWMAMFLRESLGVALYDQPKARLATVFIVGEGAREFVSPSLTRAARTAGCGVIVMDSAASAPRMERYCELPFNVQARIAATSEESTARLCLTEIRQAPFGALQQGRSTEVDFALTRSF